MRKVRTIPDVVDWGLCVGCGACYYACTNGKVSLENIDAIGIRPIFKEDCLECTECLEFCPGAAVKANHLSGQESGNVESHLLIGPTLETWEGHAEDPDIRYAASSGGILSALSLYCLEKENMEFVLHSGMDPDKPWGNKSIQSYGGKKDLLARTGSRYAPSSPCDSLGLIENSDRPCVFIGKPCDAAAVSQLRKQRPLLDKKLGLTMTFFCAGTPSCKGTVDLLKKMELSPEDVKNIHYRGNGWPGEFRVTFKNKSDIKTLSYNETWGFLQKYRSFRCNICPDGLGQLADISCGDAWHRHKTNNNQGLSLVLIRTERGREIFNNAVKAGYIKAYSSNAANVVAAQGLVKRRQEVFGRLLAMRLLLIPTPQYVGFSLFKAWMKNPISTQIKTILGTVRRLVHRGLWHRNPLK
jgi:coenzyme F420 hydrogenase subunit beta